MSNTGLVRYNMRTVVQATPGAIITLPSLFEGRDHREEIFGPVISVIKYQTVKEAIALANDSDYGLSAGVWTEDVAGAQDVARALKAGSVWINDWHMMRADAPFGGYKQSGYGREMGRYSLGSYLETKAVSTAFERDTNKKAMHNLVHKHIA